jgi:hypothetical protein
VKSNTASLVVPELVTLALVPAAHVVVVQTVIVAASHWSPLSHLISSLGASLASSVSESNIKILSFSVTSDFTSISFIGFTGIC